MLGKKGKWILSFALIIGLLAPSSVFAKSSYEESLDRTYGPENGSVTFVDPDISLLATYGGTFYTAKFEVTTHFQIPKDIKIADSNLNSLRILSEGKPNTVSSTKEYDVNLEYYSAWNGNYVGEDSVTVPVNVNRYNYFNDLSTSKTYRLRVVGNVEGFITAYKQTR